MDERIFICVRNRYVSFRVRCVLEYTFNPYDDVMLAAGSYMAMIAAQRLLNGDCR